MTNLVQTSNGNLVSSGLPFSETQINLIKTQIMDVSASIDDLMLFGTICQRTGLDPFSRQIFAVSRNVKSGDQWIKKWSFQVSIDGFRAIADKTGLYAGSDDYLFDEGVTAFECVKRGQVYPVSATVTIYKLVNGVRCSFSASALWDGYKQEFKGNLSEMWRKMPYLMLGKCAESLALRKAFPQQLGGVYTPDEYPQTSNAPNVIESEIVIEDSGDPLAMAEDLFSKGYDFNSNEIQNLCKKYPEFRKKWIELKKTASDF